MLAKYACNVSAAWTKPDKLAPFPQLVSYLPQCSHTIVRLILMRVTNEACSVSGEECVIVHWVVICRSKEDPS